MLPVTADTIRMFLHVLGATVWVGGQITLAGLLPTVRSLGPDAPAAVARRFAVVAWTGFGLLVVTGIWNLFEVDLGSTSTRYQVTLAVKLGAVALAGTFAALHSLSHTPAVRGATGALGSLASAAALFLGVLLAG